jgi:hypothetical protein
MKINNYFPIFICMISLFVFSSCEKAELQNTIGKENPIITRGPTIDCGDCPVNYCCCWVQNLDDQLDLSFCGVESPNLTTTTCSETWGNCSISGYILPVSLSPTDSEIFCAAPNSAFSVQSMSSGSARITCQYGQLSPVSIDLYFPGKKYVYVGSDCIVSGHCP